MKQKSNDQSPATQVVRAYSSGEYFSDSLRHGEDAKFKADNFLKVFLRVAARYKLKVASIVDVGCGTGDIVRIIGESLRSHGHGTLQLKAYDVSPHVRKIENEDIEFVCGDFCESDEFVDVVTLFDVFEHVPDTIEFIKSISRKCKFIGFNIPLDNSVNVAMRDLFRSKLQNPGHLIFLDTVFALNVLTLSGLSVIDYEYAFGFFAPSSRRTIFAKVAFPFRYLTAKLSPWLLSKTFGGASLIVIAATPSGRSEIR